MNLVAKLGIIYATACHALMLASTQPCWTVCVSVVTATTQRLLLHHVLKKRPTYGFV